MATVGDMYDYYTAASTAKTNYIQADNLYKTVYSIWGGIGEIHDNIAADYKSESNKNNNIKDSQVDSDLEQAGLLLFTQKQKFYIKISENYANWSQNFETLEKELEKEKWYDKNAVNNVFSIVIPDPK